MVQTVSISRGIQLAADDPTISSALLSQKLQLQQPQPPPTPILSLTEQPARFYRFRYQSEVEGSRVGGLLLGRSADSDTKSFMKLQISGIHPTVHSSLQLTVCTVSPDRAPHPYYLHGDNCHDGFYEEKKTVDGASDATWDISFSRLAVICVSRKSKDDIKKAMEARAQKVPQLPDCSVAPPVQYDSRNLGKIRLAFSLTVTDTNGQAWFCPTVFSDEILDEKEKRELDIECLNPAELPQDGGSIVAIYTSAPTTGIQKSNVEVLFTFWDEDSGIRTEKICGVEEIKKHLLTVKTPNMRLRSQSERLQCQLSVRYNEYQSRGHSIVFCATLRSEGGRVSGKSLKRSAFD